MTTGKTIVWMYGPLSAKCCLCFLIHSRFVIAFLPRRKHLLISWLQSLVISWLNVAVPFQCGSKRSWLKFIQHPLWIGSWFMFVFSLILIATKQSRYCGPIFQVKKLRLIWFEDIGQGHIASGGGGLVSKSCPTLGTPWTIARQTPLSMKFYRQEYWSGLPWLSPGIFLTQGSNPGLSHCRQILYHLSYSGILVNGQSQNPNLGLLHCQNVSYSLLLCCLPRALLNAKCQPWFWDGGSQNNLPPPPNMCIS